MQTIDETRQQLINAALQRGDDAPAELALRRWQQLAARLAPLIGEGGFCALYGRALRLSAAEFDWLTMSDNARSIAALLHALQHDLAAAAPIRAESANAKLLDAFIKLLSTLIGAELATRIIVSAWEGTSNGTETKEKHK